MQILVKNVPSPKLFARLSWNQHYNSLAQAKKSQDFNLLCRKIYTTNVSIKDLSKPYYNSLKEDQNDSNFSIALIKLNSIGNSSSRTLLIPIKWDYANERSIKSTIRNIEEFDQPHIEKHQNIKEKSEEHREITVRESQGLDGMQNGRQVSFKDSQIENNASVSNTGATIAKFQAVDYLNILTALCNAVIALASKNKIEDQNHWPLRKIETNKLNGKELFCYNSVSFLKTKNFLTHSSPIILAKKYFSTCFATFGDSHMLSTLLSNSSFHKNVTINIKRKESNNGVDCKFNPNDDYPFISKLFGVENSLMRSDAYNQALIEAAKRRAALEQCETASAELENDVLIRPQVTNIKRYSSSDFKSGPKASNPCPPPAKLEKEAKGDCKKDDPCEPQKCPDRCKDELEKVRKNEERMKKKTKLPSDCVNSKCNKDSFEKPPKSLCEMATNQVSDGKGQTCNKADDPAAYQNELKLQAADNRKETQSKTPSRFVYSYCKKASDTNTKSQCNNKVDPKKDMSDSDIKAKDQKPQGPCTDEHKEYKPKCNKDPCKTDKPPAGKPKKSSTTTKKDKFKKKPNTPKKKDPCHKDKIEQDPCNRKYSFKPKEDASDNKIKDPCKDKDFTLSHKNKGESGKKEAKDPCKKQRKKTLEVKKSHDPCIKAKKSPCRGIKKNTSPCNRYKYDRSDQNKTKDLYKDEGTKKEKNNPCQRKQEDPTEKTKIQQSFKKVKENSCQTEKVNKDPRKNKTNSPCVSDSSEQKPSPSPDSKDMILKTSTSVSASYGQECGPIKKETRPNCGKKQYSTFAAMKNKSSSLLIKRTSSTLPLFNIRKIYNFDFMRHFSSKRNKKNGNKNIHEDFGRKSKCKSVGIRVPPHRKPAYNPHPKEGLRHCYPTYDMDCKKLCKDARKIKCTKYSFLKDTDVNKRNTKK